MSYLSVVAEWLSVAGAQILFNVVVAFLLIALGIALAFVVKGLVLSVLRGVKFDEFIGSLHISDLFGKLKASVLLADIAEVVIIIAFIVQALSYLGWDLIARALESVLYWIPGVLAGLVIFMVFYAIGRWVQTRIDEPPKASRTSFAPLVMGIIVFFGAHHGARPDRSDTRRSSNRRSSSSSSDSRSPSRSRSVSRWDSGSRTTYMTCFEDTSGTLRNAQRVLARALRRDASDDGSLIAR
jgi:hypothetical protein